MKKFAATVVVAFFVCGLSAAQSQQSAPELTITILYDNTVFTQGTTADWGFSCFIQGPEDTILYDGGANGDILLNNAAALGIDLSSVKKMFLSHDHSDHVVGFTGALPRAPGVPVYVGALFSRSVLQGIALYGGQAVLVTGPVEVSSGLYSSGELASGIGAYEQTLVIDTDSGLVVVVGCSHPGIVEILKRIKEGLGRELFAVFGGFHLLDLTQPQVEAIIQEFRNLGVRKCGATHCTGEGPIQWISQAYGNDFLPMGVGRVLRFSVSNVPVNSPAIWLFPGAIDFGEEELGGRQDTVTLKMENITPRPLSVSMISHTNAAFEILDIPQLPATVQSGTPLIVRAVFHPAAPELYWDTIKVVSDDLMSPMRLIPVKGETFTVTRASENILYALGGQTDGGNLRIVDPATGSTRLIGSSGCSQIEGARVSPSTGEIIALAVDGSSTSMVRLSATGSHFVPIVKWFSTGWKGMAFRGDELYVTRASRLFSWDMKALAGTLVKEFPSQYQFSGLAYRSGQNDFLATVRTTGSAADSLYRIDPATWTITAVGPLGMTPVTDILLDDTKKLFGVLTSGTSESILLQIDQETGAAKMIGPMGAADIMALAGQGVATEAGMTNMVPDAFWLSQNYPNPFNPSTTIRYGLPNKTTVQLSVFNTLGQQVAQLVNGDMEAGYHEVRFDGSKLASGVYLYRMQAGSYVETRKLLLVR